ncbi:Oxoglutarate/iron-dependent dioxygenase - like 10 [Theobroma cacao]|uniref:2-oxoglutarate (2OG) and Fe(II)-dependent oxygenase superfamily protein, putative n=2 Tax=Theobroma cacao TaxID=3641 RepID=A0A061GB61_THECC|nr:PREDICTED: probable 2-oxoglutarate-dependent dioxygenase AOP1 [Theobroma cacao]EOY26638.1 2-oxoglutarate (2OG) and Fe(II)-dependent oxygenase superfamily protein, putative [Theobroma cacao]WRX27372.1 Oxoglutarate/iron-dependent dioxygenase - like 10 [Theobroma cacao]
MTKSAEMSSETPVRLPVIDSSKQDLKPGSADWELVKVQVRQALQEYGCFEALFDKVLELGKPLIGALEELFDLPLQTKTRYVSEKVFRGYYGPKAPLHESMVIDEANVAENVEQRLTNILWPQGNSSFSETLLSFSSLASGLEKTIRRMILESFGLEKYMDKHMESTNYILRVMKYEGPHTSEPTIGARAHSDQNMVTLLHQNEVNGLEIQTKDGEWINVKPSPASFIVMIGESLSVWLNGRLPSPYHRVMITGNKARYSSGLFATTKGGYKVKVPEELVDEENPLLFKPFDYEEFLEFYSTEAARGALGSGLKAYCSV